MHIAVSKLSVTVTDKDKQRKSLLQNVSFQIEAGDVVALMGPSGAGKTTLLNRLVGRGIRGSIAGGICYNGGSVEKARSAIGYVTQEDTMYETLTPRENLDFAAAFLQGSSTPEQRTASVSSIMTKLRLVKCADTVVGTPGLVKGISGGERKRTNVAMSLLSDPSLLLLDEPTSGLDSKMADELMADVRDVAKQGCTVVATIHQPSEAVFSRFGNVLVLEGGRTAYFGPVASLREVLVEVGFSLPQGTVPLPEMLIDFLEEPAEGKVEYQRRRERLVGKSVNTAADDTAGGAPKQPLKEVRRLGFCKQLVVLFKRSLLNFSRNKVLTRVRLGQTIMSTILIGWIFAQVENDMAGVNQRKFGGFMLAFAQFLFAMLGVVNTFPQERAVFLREAQDRWYHPAAFYLSKVLLDTCVQCLFPIITTAIGYPLIGLNMGSFSRVLTFYLFIVLLTNCGAAIGFTVSAAVSSVSTALSVAPGMIMPQLLLCGLFIDVEKMPQPFNALSYMVLTRYALQGVLTNEFICDTSQFCTPADYRNVSGVLCETSPCDFCCASHEVDVSGGICPVLTCDEALRHLGMDADSIWPSGSTNSDTVWLNVLAMVFLLVFFRCVGMLVLILSYRRAAKGGA